MQQMCPDTFGLIRNETEAKKFLITTGLLLSKQTCHICGSTRIASAGRGRNRCCDCGFIWGLRRGSIIEGTSLTYVQFIRTLRYFADSVPPAEAAGFINNDSAVIERMYRRIRLTLLNAPIAEPAGTEKRQGVDEGPVPGLQAADPAIFGIRVKHVIVTISPVIPEAPDIYIELEIPRIIRGNILFIDSCERHNHGLIVYLPDRTNQETQVYHPKNRSSWPPLTVFWRYAQTLWSRNRYMDRAQIPEFVQELAFRYNHRNADMFHVIVQELSSRHDHPDGYRAGSDALAPAGMAQGTGHA